MSFDSTKHRACMPPVLSWARRAVALVSATTHLSFHGACHIMIQDTGRPVEKAEVASAQLQQPGTDRTAAVAASSGRLQRGRELLTSGAGYLTRRPA